MEFSSTYKNPNSQLNPRRGIKDAERRIHSFVFSTIELEARWTFTDAAALIASTKITELNKSANNIGAAKLKMKPFSLESQQYLSVPYPLGFTDAEMVTIKVGIPYPAM